MSLDNQEVWRKRTRRKFFRANEDSL